MKKIYAALAAFQKECPTFVKDTQGFGYKYVELNTIVDHIKPILEKNGLTFIQPIHEGAVETTLIHIESGETITSRTEIPQGVSLKGMNDFQVLGSGISYIRRYALSSLLGIVTEKDTDAHGEQVKSQKTWLNPGTKEWKNAVEKQVDLTIVKQHYSISKENEQLYLKEIIK